ncbi:hypothetical protein C1H46_012794 [Malus baccata]|uniref:Uncharacterized protein n=1 Tax=Malus baccata TaxID=106549 RepID=A0A540MS12_MALBA|nr:hypothetical protein C1H46_012794 [Malus baccata]
MAKKGRSQKNSSSTRRLSSRLSLNQHDTTTELHDNEMQETQHANIQASQTRSSRASNLCNSKIVLTVTGLVEVHLQHVSRMSGQD